MALFLHQESYTSDSLSAQIKDPQDRLAVGIKPAIEAAGGRLVSGGYSFGEYDVTVLFEAPDDVVAASIVLTIAAGGDVRAARTARLLSGDEWVRALQGTSAVRPAYHPALGHEYIPRQDTLLASEGYAPDHD